MLPRLVIIVSMKAVRSLYDRFTQAFQWRTSIYPVFENIFHSLSSSPSLIDKILGRKSKIQRPIDTIVCWKPVYSMTSTATK